MDRDALTATAHQWVRRAAERLPASRTRIVSGCAPAVFGTGTSDC
jgi:hypothetical protein